MDPRALLYQSAQKLTDGRRFKTTSPNGGESPGLQSAILEGGIASAAAIYASDTATDRPAVREAGLRRPASTDVVITTTRREIGNDLAAGLRPEGIAGGGCGCGLATSASTWVAVKPRPTAIGGISSPTTGYSDA